MKGYLYMSGVSDGQSYNRGNCEGGGEVLNRRDHCIQTVPICLALQCGSCEHVCVWYVCRKHIYLYPT